MCGLILRKAGLCRVVKLCYMGCSKCNRLLAFKLPTKMLGRQSQSKAATKARGDHVKLTS